MNKFYRGLSLLLAFFAFAAHATTITIPPLNIKSIHDEEVLREGKGEAPRFAVPHEFSVAPASEKSVWTQEGEMMVWRQRVSAPNSVSLNFAFESFHLPQGASLEIYATDFSTHIRPFTADDNNQDRQLWTPVIMSDDVMIEARVPAQRMAELELVLTRVNQGFRTFNQRTDKAGACNIDVACPEGEGWEDEINSVAVISTGGSTFCTGFMVNNTAQDRTPFFMTANHCRINSNNAPSLVTYWNFQTQSCRGPRLRRPTLFTTGSQFLAANAASDFTLVRLNQNPNPEWNVTYAGWDRSSEEAEYSVAIHHPSTDEKSISFSYMPTTTTSYLGNAIPGTGTHVRVTRWDLGTTEPGSSGSPLFNQDHRVIGQLHGGYASCRSQTSDWYGRLSVSWDGAGTPETRLKDHLDPIGTGEYFIDTIR